MRNYHAAERLYELQEVPEESYGQFVGADIAVDLQNDKNDESAIVVEDLPTTVKTITTTTETTPSSLVHRLFLLFYAQLSDFCTYVFLFLVCLEIQRDLLLLLDNQDAAQQMLMLSNSFIAVMQFVILGLFLLELSYCLTLHHSKQNPKFFFVGGE